MPVISVAAIALLGAAALFLSIIFLAVMFLNHFRRQARRLGYSSMGEYLGAAPHTDEQKRDAVSLALKGMVTCVLGLLFPPFLLIGLIPLFYGARKVAWSSMGLGLVDDADQTGT